MSKEPGVGGYRGDVDALLAWNGQDGRGRHELSFPAVLAASLNGQLGITEVPSQWWWLKRVKDCDILAIQYSGVIFRHMHIDLYSFERGLGFLDTIAHPQCPIAGRIFTIQISVSLVDNPDIADRIAAFTLSWHTIVPRLLGLTTLVVAFRPDDIGFPNRFFNIYRAHELPNLRKLAFFAHLACNIDPSLSNSGDESSEDDGEEASVDEDEEAFVDQDDEEDEVEEPHPLWDLDHCGAWASVLCDHRLNSLHHILFSLPQPAFWPPTYRRLNPVISSWFPSLVAESSLCSFVQHAGYRDESVEILRYRENHPDPIFEELLNYEEIDAYLQDHPDVVPEQLLEGPDSSIQGAGDPSDLGIPGVIFERSVVEEVSVWRLVPRWGDPYCGLGEHLFFDQFQLAEMWRWRLSGDASAWIGAERE
ncbi:hypothetical protein R3P38DRAFT_2788178 [Favolaschia claudopus]|uniref:Uncharacterized protein n=1 Tax=Favolaschia claudopus TaxID=2862362 RepID=A0AAW0AL58_9AGAR